jgi:hypothetical protein
MMADDGFGSGCLMPAVSQPNLGKFGLYLTFADYYNSSGMQAARFCPATNQKIESFREHQEIDSKIQDSRF